MATKPTVYPRWADVGGAITEPTSGKKDVGFVGAERPPAEYLNWLLYYLYLWTTYVGENEWEGPVLITGDGSLSLTIDNGDFNAIFVECSEASVQGPCSVAEDLTVEGALYTSGRITPTALSGDENNYAPTGYLTTVLFRLDPNGATRTISGIAGGADGRRIIVCNISTGAFDLVLKHQSGLSSAANQFCLPGGVDMTLDTNDSVEFYYDGASSKWRALGL